ncbi:ABC transporter permease subunit [Mucisphaera sp.]|uniref:ABC transporter permease subunit n=1 Tax=Mucisphaera sp. TaxID=2913024 RepID=UPI003D10349D
MPSSKQFTGRNRRKTTGLSTKLVDRLARVLITVGGIGTIVAVSLVAIFLAYVTVPLFMEPTVGGAESIEVSEASSVSAETLWISVDEYQLMALRGRSDGGFEAIDLRDGVMAAEEVPFSGQAVTASSRWEASDTVVLGFEDGGFAVGSVGFETRFLTIDEAPASWQALEVGESLRIGGEIAERIDARQLRVQSLSVAFEPAIASGAESPVLLIDRNSGGDLNQTVVMLTEARDVLRSIRVRRTENFLTGEITLRPRTTEVAFEDRPERMPVFLGLTALGDTAMLVWDDGQIDRYDLRRGETQGLVERVELPIEGNATIARMLIGRETLLVGTDTGKVAALFRTRTEEGAAGDGFQLLTAHVLGESTSPVRSLSTSSRSRLIAVGHEDGKLELIQVTSELSMLPEVSYGSLDAIAFAPKEDGIIAWSEGGLVRWTFDTRHPEATFKSLFLPVWYEGYPEAQHVWQSSGATDAHEPKFGLMPLIFGTLKATFFAMLFATPLALLAAVYSSEYLTPAWRGRIKPTLETMASLPSVVLGFMGGLVVAPFVEQHLAAVLGAVVVLPIALVTGAYLWPLLPEKHGGAARRFRMVGVWSAIVIGLGLGWLSGGVIESLLFSGDVRRWLDGQIGSAFGGLFLLALPVCCLASAYWMGGLLTDRMRSSKIESSSGAASANLLKWGAILLVGFGLAAVTGWLMTLAGLDPRPGVLDTYVQRNATIVGFVMGFAVIPIIYTIADDALTAVPNHLRSASLGAGATPWQTATRVVIPIAASGLFSALMIGLGRAVGETMIVLMAAGNTPVMDLNPFNGFRTMSANIAVELPEAVRDSTHYRTLFLAALLLFLMTFVLNTVAEIVRARFRKRAQVL